MSEKRVVVSKRPCNFKPMDRERGMLKHVELKKIYHPSSIGGDEAFELYLEGTYIGKAFEIKTFKKQWETQAFPGLSSFESGYDRAKKDLMDKLDSLTGGDGGQWRIIPASFSAVVDDSLDYGPVRPDAENLGPVGGPITGHGRHIPLPGTDINPSIVAVGG